MCVTVNKEKCRFSDEVEFNWIMIDRSGVRTNPKKVQAVLDALAPKNIKELQSFIGAINYYGKYIKDFASVANTTFCITKQRNVLFHSQVEP